MANPLLHYEHNWATELEEKFSYLTDILTVRTGDEQRIAVRRDPRLSTTLTYTLNTKNLRTLRNLLMSSRGSFIVPDFLHTVKAESVNHYPSLSLIYTDPRPDYFVFDQFAVLEDRAYLLKYGRGLAPDPNVDSPENSLNLMPGELGDKSKMVLIFTPGFLCTIESEPSFNQLTADLADMTITFLRDPSAGAIRKIQKDFTFSEYKNTPIFPFSPNRSRDITDSYRKISDIFDPGIGIFHQRNLSSSRTYQMSFDLFDQEIEQFKGFMHKMMGAQGQFFIDSQNYDLLLLSDIEAGSSTIVVENSELSSRSGEQLFISICCADGTKVYRKIAWVEKLSSEVEVVTVDEPLTEIASEDVERISFLECVRFASDDFTFKYQTSKHATITKNIKTVSYKEREDV